MATPRTARIVLQNKTGSYFKLQVLHQYTGQDTDDSGWHTMAPEEEKEMFASVNFWTGMFTTGCDNWKIHGTQLIEVGSDNNMAFKFLGKFMVDGLPYNSYHGFGASWKKHTLRTEDDGKDTIIKVFKTEIQFISPSGTSTTRFDTVADSAGRIM